MWSYGIFLYELITGRRPFDRNRPRNEQNILEWIRPHLTDIKKFKMIIDPRLEGNYYLKSALKLAAVANRCLMVKAKSRPTMGEVSEMLERIVESSDEVSPALPLVKSLTPKDAFEASRRERVKKRFVELVTGVNGCPNLPTWSPKLVTSLWFLRQNINKPNKQELSVFVCVMKILLSLL